MVLEFKLKKHYFDLLRIKGPNHFIKDPNTGNYKNYGVGKLKNIKLGFEFKNEELEYLMKKKLYTATLQTDDKSE